MSKAVLFFADGTEECEALLVADLLRRARVEVIIASAMGRRALVSSHGIHLNADALAEDVDYSDVDMVILPGRHPGYAQPRREQDRHRHLRFFWPRQARRSPPSAPRPASSPASACWKAGTPPPTPDFRTSWPVPIVHDEEVVVDGSITTSYGLGGAIPFALELVRQLAGPAEADRIQKAIAYRH